MEKMLKDYITDLIIKRIFRFIRREMKMKEVNIYQGYGESMVYVNFINIKRKRVTRNQFLVTFRN